MFFYVVENEFGSDQCTTPSGQEEVLVPFGRTAQRALVRARAKAWLPGGLQKFLQSPQNC